MSDDKKLETIMKIKASQGDKVAAMLAQLLAKKTGKAN